ncbi:MAG: metalloregulator ArsR/SmtB family transcription factor [Candidatus Andersenbacteria bacterium]
MLSNEEVKKIRSTHIAEGSRLPRIFSVLGDANRWRIFTLLIEYNDLCVTDLANVLEVSVPAVSQQLRMMEMSGLIAKEREGQKICYQVSKNDPVTRVIVRLVKTFKRSRIQ